MEPLKNIYNNGSVALLSKSIKKEHKSFNEERFLNRALKNHQNLEMKDRVIQISEALNKELPSDYKSACHILTQTLKSKKNPLGLEGFILWPYTQYIESQGLHDFKTSMSALSEITKRFTSEFGVRPFFEAYPEKTYDLFHKYCSSKDEHLRRWVSEGTRPNLPWGKSISHIHKNLKKNIELLEKLKDDPSEYVRKSVANHMNDISRLNEDLALKTLLKWSKKKTLTRQALLNRALRTLLKNGNKKALSIMGFHYDTKSKVTNLKLSKKVINEGESLDLTFDLKNEEPTSSSFMVDFNIHYQKKTNKSSVKTFKLKSLFLEPNEQVRLYKKISFKKVTTRSHYPGEHKIEIQINGSIKAQTKFKLAKLQA